MILSHAHYRFQQRFFACRKKQNASARHNIARFSAAGSRMLIANDKAWLPTRRRGLIWRDKLKRRDFAVNSVLGVMMASLGMLADEALRE